MAKEQGIEQEGVVLYRALFSGNWRVFKCQPLSWMSDSALERTKTEWAVERLAPPYCCNGGEQRGVRLWTGNSPSAALLEAARELGTEGFELEPDIAAAIAAASRTQG